MTVEVREEGDGRRNVVVGIRIDGHSRELLSWALVKVADPGDHVVAIHVSRDLDSKEKPLLDGYLQDYESICNIKEVDLTGQVVTGSSIRKVLVREAKNRGAGAVIVGISRGNPLSTWASLAKYCAKHLPPTTDVLAIHNGKVVFRRSSNYQPPGYEGDPRPSLSLFRNPTLTDNRSEFDDSETSEIDKYSLDNFNPLRERKALSMSSFSYLSEDLAEHRPGWPLLRVVSPPTEEARKMSVVKWVMRLPKRSSPQSPLSNASSFSSIEAEIPFSTPSKNPMDRRELLENLEKIFLKNPSVCKWFSYEVLKTSTSQFSSDKLIGKGGCNCVYKGILPDGKQVAVKVILKSCEEAWKDFTQEVGIMTSLKHKNITPLIGICVEDNALISVYDFLPKGNLEENLHGNNKEKFQLSWEVRFQVVVGIAEALNYLHNECSPPVIHRDVKSSNILLFDKFEPQLSDFGLATWGPSDSSFLTDKDVVGTFGYLAPEYFMYGKVSDKIDVYSFGVVLLELLSGRKPISSESTKGQESLVMWAKPKLESGDLRSILDPILDGNIDEVQFHRMALAVRLCLTRSARLRPKMSQILKILKGENDAEEWLTSQYLERKDCTENEENKDDEVYPHSSTESHFTLALLDMEDTSTSFSSFEQSTGTSSEKSLKERWSRSSSLD